MNPQQQQDRHTAISAVHDRIDTLAGAVDAEVAERVQEMRLLVTRLLSAEHADRLSAEQRTQLIQLAVYGKLSRNMRSIVTLNFYASQFLQMNLRERVRWMLLGRLPEHLAEFAEDPEAVLLSEPLSEASESASETSEV